MNEHSKYYITYMKFHADAIHDSANVIHKEKMMNELIRQLYYECQDESQSTEQCYQQFAELIVAECINKIITYDLVPGHSAKWEDIYDIHTRLLQDLGEELKEHFGVIK